MHGMTQLDTPHWGDWGCPKCTYMFTIRDSNGGFADVYLSCETRVDKEPIYIIRFGEEEKYFSSVSLRLLFWYFLIGHNVEGFIGGEP